MKRLVVLLLVALGMPIFAFSQVNNDTVHTEQARLDSIRFKMEMDSIRSALDFRIDSLNRAIDSIYQVAIQEKMEYAKKMQEATMVLPRFKIYPTDNIYILLKLDTKRGKVWMVQYGVGSTKPAEIPIKYSYMVSDDEGWNGRFDLYPTKNMYNFIMVDNYDGETFQVQWDTDPDYRVIRSITNY
jgi:hypothetical protein